MSEYADLDDEDEFIELLDVNQEIMDEVARLIDNEILADVRAVSDLQNLDWVGRLVDTLADSQERT